MELTVRDCFIFLSAFVGASARAHNAPVAPFFFIVPALRKVAVSAAKAFLASLNKVLV